MPKKKKKKKGKEKRNRKKGNGNKRRKKQSNKINHMLKKVVNPSFQSYFQLNL